MSLRTKYRISTFVAFVTMKSSLLRINVKNIVKHAENSQAPARFSNQ